MTIPIKSIFVKDPITARDDMIRTYKNALINRGVPAPQVGPGTEPFVLFTAIANELAVANANVQIAADNQMPDTATGANLDRQLLVYGQPRRSAAGSVGRATFTSSATSLIPAGGQLLDTAGLRFQATLGGSVANGATFAISAIDTGKTTNHANGDVLRWVSQPPYSSPTVTVGALGGGDGLTGGVDTEDDPTAQARLLNYLANPPGGGNWSQVALFATQSSPNVQAATVYPGVNGPSTVHVAVWTYATSVAAANAKNRDVDTTTLTSVVTPYIQGLLAEYAEVTVTTVTNVPTDAAIGLALPASPLASPPGPGGGWLDGAPWPTPLAGVCTVTAVTSSTVFTVTSNTVPTDNVSRIAFIDPTTWTLYTAKVLLHTGTGPYVITVDTPWPNIAIGNYVFPQAVNTQTYVNSILQAFAQMGPGEKVLSTNSGYVRGYRHPLPSQAYPYTLGPVQLQVITNNSSEVLSTSFVSQSQTTPAVPGAVANPPSIITPRNIGIYAL